jgi:hypothetical protein
MRTKKPEHTMTRTEYQHEEARAYFLRELAHGLLGSRRCARNGGDADRLKLRPLQLLDGDEPIFQAAF